MALQVQWANGFEDLSPTPSTSGIADYSNLVVGWEGEYSNYTSALDKPRFMPSTSNPHLRGTWVYPNFGWTVSNPTMIPRLFKNTTDDDKMVLGTAYCLKTPGTNATKIAFGFRGISGDTIHVRPVNVSGSYFVGLYINDVLVSTGTGVEIGTGSPWVYVELFVNKTTGLVTVEVSGVPECSAPMPSGFIGSQCEITLKDWSSGTFNGGSSVGFDDMVYYIDSDPIGIIKVDGFYKTGDVLSGFSDGTDGGSTNTNGIVNSGFTNYRASSTSNQEDRFSYNNILPTGVQADSIIGVIPSVLASSGSYTNANLELRFTSGSNTSTTDVTSKAKPFTPQLITGPVLHTDPNTGLAWTRENVQNIQTGYRVKP